MNDQLVYQSDVSNSSETKRDSEAQESNSSRKAYQESIAKLNSLQPLPRELEKNPTAGDGATERLTDSKCGESMIQCFARCGVSMEAIFRMPVIHVAGTKGKGSVCAFSESILRKYGLKTGLFTSPHLIEVRERFRINGKPIDCDKFVRYFSEVFSQLEETKEDFGGGMPVYKKMLCVLGFYIFLKEKVDVAVIEVVLGGEYDVTNFIRDPIVTGISSLGMDHVERLGNTITEIAWHKAGILKPGRPAFTVPQPEDAMKVILDRAKEIGATVQCVPAFEYFDLGKYSFKLGIPGNYQRANATLAIQLCRNFLEITKNTNNVFKEIPTNNHPTTQKLSQEESNLSNGSNIGMKASQPFVLPDEFVAGLRDCYWPGRSQILVRDRVTYYLDCAHTEKSIKYCVEWFLEASREEEADTHGSTVKMLVFNLKANKYKPSLIRPLLKCGFAGTAFCPSYINDGENPPDQSFLAHKRDEEFCNSQNIKRKFEDLVLGMPSFEEGTSNNSQSLQETEKEALNLESSKLHFRELKKPTKCVVLPSISAALRWASGGKDGLLGPPNTHDSLLPGECLEADRIQVLITGSLYLIGGALHLLDPKLAIK